MSERKEYKFQTTINEFGRLIWDCTQYCAGRRSYAPSICEDIIRRNAGIILFPWRAYIISYVMWAFADDFQDRVEADKARRAAQEAGDPEAWRKAYHGGTLGADFDGDGWMQAVTFLAKHDDVDPDLVKACWDGEDAPVTATFGDADDFWFMVSSVIRKGSQTGECLFSAGELTDVVRRQAGSLSPKWVSNLSRDIDDGVFMAFLSPENRGKVGSLWDDMREILINASTTEPEPYTGGFFGGPHAY